MRHWHFCFRPPWEQDAKNSPADLTVQFTDPIDGAAAPDGQVSHVEGFRQVLAIATTHCQKLLERNRQVLLSILPEVSLDQAGSEAVKASLYGSMSCKKIAGTSDGKREIEWLIIFFHV